MKKYQEKKLKQIARPKIIFDSNRFFLYFYNQIFSRNAVKYKLSIKFDGVYVEFVI